MSESTATEEKGKESIDNRIELSDDAAAATKTALNGMERYEIANEISVRFGETSIPAEDKPIALDALKEQWKRLESVEGEPTLFDPNGEDYYLQLTRKALAELTGDKVVEAEAAERLDEIETEANR